MKAIGYSECLPIQDPLSLQDIELPQPVATGSDLLIKVKAIAVNPVDSKIRHRVAAEQGQYKVIGWDGVGEVVSLGDKASLFKLGDQVFYAGDLNRQGCNAEYQLVDERLVGHKPQNLTTADAAALPLTSITAWEMLFDHLTIKQQAPEHIVKTNEILLIVGAAGGVGSILIQIAKAITGATVIATAARESSQSWVKKLGADYVIDHNKPLASQIKALGIGPVTHIASLNNTDAYFDAYTEILPPFGKIAMIDDPEKPLDVMKLKPKSLSLHIEFMFARAMFNASDMAEQGRLLNRIAELVDQGYIQTTAGKNLGLINADNLKAAHKIIESRSAIGKIVLQGF